MNRRRYLLLSTGAIATVAGCSGESSQGSTQTEATETTQIETETQTEVPTETETENPTANLDPVEFLEMSVKPERKTPGDGIPRGVNLIATISGGAPIYEGSNSLEARITVQTGAGKVENEISKTFQVTSESSTWVEFKKDLSISTNPYPQGSYFLIIRLFDERMNAETVEHDAQFQMAGYNVRQLKEVRGYLEKARNMLRDSVERYTNYSSTDSLADVQILTESYSASAVIDPTRGYIKVIDDADSVGVDPLESEIDRQLNRIETMRKVARVHESLRSHCKTIVNDLGILREYKFEEYRNSFTQYEAVRTTLSDEMGQLQNYVNKIKDSEDEFDFVGRMETFRSDLNALWELDTVLEYVVSAVERLAIALAYYEEGSRERREARLDILDKTKTAKDLLRNITFPTAKRVPVAVSSLISDIEAEAENL